MKKNEVKSSSITPNIIFIAVIAAVVIAALVITLMNVLQNGEGPEQPFVPPHHAMFIENGVGMTSENLRNLVEWGMIRADTQIVNLANNNIYDISPLASLELLSELTLDSNAISSLTPLESAAGLTRLSLARNFIRDVTPLAELVNLTDLQLWGNEIRYVDALAGLINLISLDLHSNYIYDLEPLAGLVNLTRLGLAYNDIDDITPLKALTNLVFLDISDNPLIPQEAIDELKLALPNTAITYGAFEPIFPQITPAPVIQASITAQGVTDGLLAEMVEDGTIPANVQRLDLRDNYITDVTPLAGLTLLTHLFLGGNNIEDVSPLVTLINLTDLDLFENLITDVSAIAELPSIEFIELSFNPLSDQAVEELQNALPGVIITFRG